mmetsp:Transcript_30795/g.48280  ORF Transcript_30795/g.48280 Transcript_30795/m.48280 type:complete len:105 (+) Transcript_30795:94-408(+)
MRVVLLVQAEHVVKRMKGVIMTTIIAKRVAKMTMIAKGLTTMKHKMEMMEPSTVKSTVRARLKANTLVKQVGWSKVVDQERQEQWYDLGKCISYIYREIIKRQH